MTIDLPEVTFQICTYNRLDELTRTLEALKKRVLQYDSKKIKWLICDDSSPDDYRDRIRASKIYRAIEKGSQIDILPTPANSGWGANVNNGLRHIDTEYIFFVEDDYVLNCPLDLEQGVALLETKRDIGMLRYRGTAGDHVIYHQFEADVTGKYRIPKDGGAIRQGLGLPNKVTYLQLDSGSPTLYLYSHGAHLKRKSFHNFYGLYPEGLKLGQTEEAYAHIVKDRMKLPNAPAIAILPDWIFMQWDHIGKSYQHTEFDK